MDSPKAVTRISKRKYIFADATTKLSNRAHVCEASFQVMLI